MFSLSVNAKFLSLYQFAFAEIQLIICIWAFTPFKSKLEHQILQLKKEYLYNEWNGGLIKKNQACLSSGAKSINIAKNHKKKIKKIWLQKKPISKTWTCLLSRVIFWGKNKNSIMGWLHEYFSIFNYILFWMEME